MQAAGKKNEEIRVLKEWVEEIGKREGQRKAEHLRREAGKAAREKATAAKHYLLIGAFASM